jgi:1-acyl-sn-glycerol-3-phosphate acyltransferase
MTTALVWARLGATLAARAPSILAMSASDPDAAYARVMAWAREAQRAAGLDVRIRDENGGRYPAPPYVFVQLNQSSFLDTIVVPPSIPVTNRPIVNVEFAFLPIYGWLAWATGAFVVTRQSPERARRTMARALEATARGTSVVVSIEGRRSRDGTLTPYKKGPAVLAIQAQAAIVPLVVRGTYEALPFGAWSPRPGPVEVTFCPAIPTKGLAYGDRDGLVAALRDVAMARVGREPVRA